MQRFLKQRLAGLSLDSDTRAALIDALYVKDQLKLEYDSTMTRHAAQAVAARHQPVRFETIELAAQANRDLPRAG